MISPLWSCVIASTLSSKTAFAHSRAQAFQNLPFSAFAPNQAWLEATLVRARPDRLDPAAALRRRPRHLRTQAAAARRRTTHPTRASPHAAPPGRLALGRRDRPSVQAPRRDQRLIRSAHVPTTTDRPAARRARPTRAHRARPRPPAPTAPLQRPRQDLTTHGRTRTHRHDPARVTSTHAATVY